MDNIDERITNFLIDASLPKNALFCKENFAGDEFVKDFFQLLVENTKFDLTIFITWACLPDVSILRKEKQFILLRSERLDTLVIEYFHLKKSYSQFEPPLRDEFIASTILRWQSEFFIGFKDAQLAMDSWDSSRESCAVHLPVLYLRDEALASLSLSEKMAIQCYSIAHEIGHIVNPKREKVDIHFTFDGLELLRHVKRDFLESGTAKKLQKHILEIAKKKIDYSNLIYEIEADLYALRNVVIYLHFHLSFSLEESFRQTLSAFSGLMFVNSCKKSSALIKNSLKEEFKNLDYTEKYYLDNLEMYIRTKCALRRAGILWAQIENQDKKAKKQDYSEYVKKVDALFLGYQNFYFDIASSQEANSRNLINGNVWLTREERTNKFQLIKNKAFKDHEGSFEFWKVLHAFRLHASIDSLNYIEQLHEQNLN